jgi:hypothetical protein
MSMAAESVPAADGERLRVAAELAHNGYTIITNDSFASMAQPLSDLLAQTYPEPEQCGEPIVQDLNERDFGAKQRRMWPADGPVLAPIQQVRFMPSGVLQSCACVMFSAAKL